MNSNLEGTESKTLIVRVFELIHKCEKSVKMSTEVSAILAIIEFIQIIFFPFRSTVSYIYIYIYIYLV